MYFDDITYLTITTKNNPNGLIHAFVPVIAAWVGNGLTRDFDKQNADRITSELIDFYVFCCLNSGSSAQSISLSSYGWEKPWAKPELLQRKLKDSSTNPQLYYSSKDYKDLPYSLEKSRLDVPIDANELFERACFYNAKNNQTLSLMTHIRNSLCHGRFTTFYSQDTYWFVMEDVAGKPIGRNDLTKLSARIVLRLDTLMSWIDIIKRGPKNAKY